MTSFTGNPFAGGAIFEVSNVGAKLGAVSSIVPATLNSALPWPNTAVRYNTVVSTRLARLR
jgi:hypothetical protein